jgi:hypothetical protein
VMDTARSRQFPALLRPQLPVTSGAYRLGFGTKRLAISPCLPCPSVGIRGRKRVAYQTIQ